MEDHRDDGAPGRVRKDPAAARLDAARTRLEVASDGLDAAVGPAETSRAHQELAKADDEVNARAAWAAWVEDGGDLRHTDGPNRSDDAQGEASDARPVSEPGATPNGAAAGTSDERLHDLAHAVRDHEHATNRAFGPPRSADSHLYRRLRQALRRLR